jgi:2-hydroxychromene-2-carboxylate isomerase
MLSRGWSAENKIRVGDELQQSIPRRIFATAPGPKLGRGAARMNRPKLEFWFEFASTYSYPAAMRIERATRDAGVDLVWRPFLLGPILKSLGQPMDSPFNRQPVKLRYMLRDVERVCSAIGINFRKPDPFPQFGLLAARTSLVAFAGGFGPDFVRAVYRAEFAEGRQIAEPGTIAGLLRGLGQAPEPVLEAANSDAIKSQLRAQTERGAALGMFGAPNFVTENGELFWGNDRLEAALDWSRKHGKVN